MSEDRPPSRPPPSTADGVRPGTAAARRPKTAGRNTERPPTSMARRPPSRIGIAAPAPIATHGMSAVNQITAEVEIHNSNNNHYQTSSSRASFDNREEPRLSSRVASAIGVRRRGTATAIPPFRHGTAVAPGTSAAARVPGTGRHRPVTQQGVSGVRTLSRAGTAFADGRLVIDKNYYMALLNNQLKALTDEIGALGAELERTERGRQNLLFYEQQAEERATELKQLQTELASLNMIIDHQHTNTDPRDLEFEVLEAERRNAELSAAVDELFRQRREKEALTEEMDGRLAAARRTSDALGHGGMETTVRDELDRLKRTADDVRATMEARQQELDALTRQREAMEMALSNSPMKQQAMALEEQIRVLEERKAALTREQNAAGTMEEQRDQLIERIQKDNEEIAHMQAQIAEMNERIVEAQEEIREFTNEFDILASDKSERFRELRTRDAHIDAFLDAFDETRAEAERRIHDLQARVVQLLHAISANCHHLELVGGDTREEMPRGKRGSVKSLSVGELQNLNARLQTELHALSVTEAQLRAEFDAMRRKQAQLDASRADVLHLDTMHAQSQADRDRLEERRRELRELVSRCEAENFTALEKCSHLERLLNNMTAGGDPGANKGYFVKMRELKSRVDVVEGERRLLSEKLEREKAKIDFELAKREAQRLQREYNILLTTSSTTRQSA